MITVSKEMKAYLSRTGRSLNAKIKVGETEISEGIMSVLVDSTMCADSLSFGCVNTSYAEISLFNCPENISGCEIEAYIIAEVNGADEEALIGTFKVEKPKTEEGLTTFTAYDKTKYNTSGVYITAFESAEVPIDDVFNEVCGQCNAEGVPLFLSETPDTDKPKINPKLLDGYVLKDVLGQIAGFMGGNLVCNNEGKFEVRRFTDCGITLDGDMCESPTVSEDVFILNSLTCINGETILTSGEGKGINFENILMTQEQLDAILAQYKGLTYRDTDVTNLVGNPCLQAGDIVTLEIGENTYRVPIMHITVDYDGGIMNEIQAYYKTDDESSGGHVSLSKKVTQNENSIKLQEELRKTFNETLKTGLQQGLYHKTITNAEGADITYYFNKPEIEDATYIYYFGAAGQVWTSGTDCWNGGNPVWKFGTTSDGDAILENLLLRTLTADLIRAGTLQSLNGSTSFNLDKNTIDSVQEEIAPYIFVYGLTEYREILLHLSASSAIYNGEVTQHIKFSFVKETTADDENAVKYVTAGGTTKYYVANDTVDEYDIVTGAKGVKITSNDNYYTKTGTVYFKKDEEFAEWEKWKSEGTAYQKLVAGILIPIRLLTEYVVGEASSNGVNISSIAMNDDGAISGSMTTLGSNGIKVYEPSTGNVTVIDKGKIAFVTSNAEGNATEQEAGFMAFDRGDGTRLYGNVSDVYAFRNGATALPAFTKDYFEISDNSPGKLDLEEIFGSILEQTGAVHIRARITLMHYNGNSEYIILWNTTSEQIFIDCRHITGSSSSTGYVKTPVLQGINNEGTLSKALTVGERPIFYGTSLDIVPKVAGTDVDSYVAAVVEVLTYR